MDASSGNSTGCCKGLQLVQGNVRPTHIKSSEVGASVEAMMSSCSLCSWPWTGTEPRKEYRSGAMAAFSKIEGCAYLVVCKYVRVASSTKPTDGVEYT